MMLSLAYPVYLASTSPRRKEILKKIVSQFSIIDPRAIEIMKPALGAQRIAERNSLLKLLAARSLVNDPIYLMIAADTVVFVKGEILGKPSNQENAFMMLNRLQGKVHEVITGVSLFLMNLEKTIMHTYSEKATVTFRSISTKDIVSYLKKFQPFDKAGAYGIQEVPNHFIEKIEGDIDTIIGLPYHSLMVTLERWFL